MIETISAADIKNKDEYINDIIQKVSNGTITFPYLKYFIKNVDELFSNLQEYKPVVIDSHKAQPRIGNYKYGNKSNVYILSDDNTYFSMNIITELYSEEVRMKCFEKGLPAPIEKWKDPNVLHAALDICINKYKKVDGFILHEALWQTGMIRACTNYKPSVCVALAKFFDSKRVLDLSCGWGDRLIGFLAADVEVYDGCDPSPDTYPRYQEIIKNHSNKGNNIQSVNIVKCKAEEYSVKSNYYDLFHSSPPFWTKEIYATNDPNVSLKSWINDFLYPYLITAHKGLMHGGILSIYISDFAGAMGMCDIMNDFIKNSLKCKFIMVIGLATVKNAGEEPSRAFPIWVWQKV